MRHAVHNFQLALEPAVINVDRSNRKRGGAVFRVGLHLLQSAINVRQAGGLAEGVLAHVGRGVCREAKDVRELLDHGHEEDVEPRKGMPRKTLAAFQVDVLGRQRVIRLREIGFLLDRRDLAYELLVRIAFGENQAFGKIIMRGKFGRLHVALLAGCAQLTDTGLAAGQLTQTVRVIGCLSGAEIAESPFCVGGLLEHRPHLLALVENRQMHRVATAADIAGLEGHILLRRQPQ